jgi:Ca-activated chloride channel family protein
MERARLKIADLAAARKGQPLGLIVYAGSAHLVLPPTKDTAVVGQMAAEISPEIMPTQGDRLDLALKKAGDLLSEGTAGGRILVMADSLSGDPASAKAALDQGGSWPVQFFAITGPDSPDLASVQATAKALGAPVQQLTTDDADIQAVVRAAARAPVRSATASGSRWQEAGYWLTPVLALLMAGSFRRNSKKTPHAP